MASNPLAGLSIVLSLILAALYGWLLHYLLRLKQTGCACALGWRWYPIVAFIGLTLVNVLATAANGGDSALVYLPEVVATAFGLFGLFNIYAILSYVHELKRESCRCSEGAAREVLKVVAIVQLVVIIIAVITAVMIVGILGSKLGKARPRGSRAKTTK